MRSISTTMPTGGNATKCSRDFGAAGHDDRTRKFFPGLIQLAAANLKRFLGYEQAAEKLARSGLARLKRCLNVYMGIEVASSLKAPDSFDTPTRAESYQVHLTLETPASLKGSKI